MTAKTKRLSLGALRVVLGVIFAVATLLPLAWMLSTSFMQRSEVRLDPPHYLPQAPTLDNFATLVDQGAIPYFVNSVIAALGGTALTLVLAIPLAYALSVHRFPRDAGKHVGLGLLALRFIPAFALILPLLSIVQTVRLIDTPWALVLVYGVFHVALAVWIVRPAVDAMPNEIREAGRIDGAGEVRIFTQLTLPVLRPSIATAALLTAIYSWNEFFFALILTVTDKGRTVPLLLTTFISENGPDYGAIAATSLLATIPIIIFCLFAQRSLRGGLALGAVK